MENNSKSKPKFNFTRFNPQAMIDWNNMFAEKPEKDKEEERITNFKKRLEGFKDVETLEEAKNLLNKIMPVRLERTVFFIGKAKCTIINKSDRVRISLDSEKEFISYDFA